MEQAARPERAEALSPGQWNKQHALKGQKLLAQGNALGIMPISKAPCKGKSFVYYPGILKLLPLQGERFVAVITQGDALG